MKTPSPTRRDFAALEQRRLAAARYFAQGKSRAVVARLLKVSWPAVNNWHRAWRQDGEAGLKAAGHAGRNPKLTADQLARVEQELLRGPTAQGYGTEVWTLPRIAKMICKLTGVQYHPGHVWRILRGLGWSVQRPEHRAKERDDEVIESWVKRRWPQRKRGH